MAILRTGTKVCGLTEEAVLRRLDMLVHLRKTSIPAFVEFVRLARRRRHQIFGNANVRLLREMGLIDQAADSTLTAHDMDRELVRCAVVGDDMSMMLVTPFAVSGTVPQLRIDKKTTVDPHLLQDFRRQIDDLYVSDPVAWASLVRMCMHQTKPFGRSLATLIERGYAEACLCGIAMHDVAGKLACLMAPAQVTGWGFHPQPVVCTPCELFVHKDGSVRKARKKDLKAKKKDLKAKKGNAETNGHSEGNGHGSGSVAELAGLSGL